MQYKPDTYYPLREDILFDVVQNQPQTRYDASMIPDSDIIVIQKLKSHENNVLDPVEMRTKYKGKLVRIEENEMPKEKYPLHRWSSCGMLFMCAGFMIIVISITAFYDDLDSLETFLIFSILSCLIGCCCYRHSNKLEEKRKIRLVQTAKELVANRANQVYLESLYQQKISSELKGKIDINQMNFDNKTSNQKIESTVAENMKNLVVRQKH